MNFKYSGIFTISNNDIEEMCKKNRKGLSIDNAIMRVAEGWGDIDYYTFCGCEDIYNQIENEVKKRCKK